MDLSHATFPNFSSLITSPLDWPERWEMLEERGTILEIKLCWRIYLREEEKRAHNEVSRSLVQDEMNVFDSIFLWTKRLISFQIFSVHSLVIDELSSWLWFCIKFQSCYLFISLFCNIWRCFKCWNIIKPTHNLG